MSKERNSKVFSGRLPYQKLVPVPVGNVRIIDEFWSPKLDVIRTVTVHDVFDKFHQDRGGAVENFDRVSRGERGEHAGPPWYDGLIWESMRGAADFLAIADDKALDARLDGYIERMAAAQQTDPDGYLNTWVTLLSPGTRWGKNGGNIVWQHDIYNAGCLIEAAVHHYRATGKISLLKLAVRFADYMSRLMGPPPRENIVPAHALAEEALIKLYQLFREEPNMRERFTPAVREEKYLELVRFWINNRGNTTGRQDMGEYAQDHKAVVEMEDIVGHAVRATLMFTGVAALAMATGEQTYFDVAERVWNNAVTRRMYLTGSGGAHHHHEKFGSDYDLPNDGYLETCAAVAMGFWHHNMNLAFAEGHYVDELERAIYNGVLVGVSLEGDKYFYTNPLICRDHNRWDWHGCPCCPPMLLKILAALPSYIYASDKHAIYVNLFVGSRAAIPVNGSDIDIEQETRYPWDGRGRLTIRTGGDYAVYIRVPGWVNANPSYGDLYHFENNGSGQMTFNLNGKNIDLGAKNGYVKIERKWQSGDEIEYQIPMPVRIVTSHPNVMANTGKIALMRGPLVYCLEGVDNNEAVDQLFISAKAVLKSDFRKDILGGVCRISGIAEEKVEKDEDVREIPFQAIPYYAQNNRGSTAMSVWLDTGIVPEIRPQSTIFLDNMEVRLSAAFSKYQVRFTTDGWNPTTTSALYQAPFTLNDTTVVKAQAFRNNRAVSPVVNATFTRVILREPDTPEHAIPGLIGEYYVRELKNDFPDFSQMVPDVKKSMPEISLAIVEAQHNFVVRYTGYFAIESAGIYSFYLTSEGLSKLSIGGSALVTNEGSSGMKEVGGKIALDAGKHEFELYYCQKGGGKVLQVAYEGPGVQKQRIPGTVVFHKTG